MPPKKMKPSSLTEQKKKISLELQSLEIQQKKIHEKKAEIIQGLPHLYGWKWYAWARHFFESKNSMNLLCAANQISKSSTQIRKAIHWATTPKLWNELWPNRKAETKIQFWYLYPSQEVASLEFENKWVPEFMPRGKYKDDPIYGWEPEYEKGNIKAIHFKSGVSLYFKFYSQSVTNLQTATIHAIFCFVANTLVITSNGLKEIKDILPGDFVFTGKTWNKVLKNQSHQAGTITREFTNGEKITATLDHPFFTYNRGWVAFLELTGDDQCATVPEWILVKKLLSLEKKFTSAVLAIQTRVKEIISVHRPEMFSTVKYGKPSTTKKYQEATSSITKMATHWTILLKIYSFLHLRIIREFTKRKNGEEKKNGHLIANNAATNLYREAQKEQHQDSVLKGVGKRLAKFVVNVLPVRLCLKLATTRIKDSALSLAQIKTNEVFNLTIEENPYYFANGIFVHNCDEELPEEHYAELAFRLTSTDGYFHMVFTATLNQPTWHRAMEEKGDAELFPDANKQQVSMYDCMVYDDGTPGPWTEEKINRAKARCQSPSEIQRRIYGRFITEVGRKFGAFSAARHFVKPFLTPESAYRFYAGVDVGSGGEKNHPAAIVFLAVHMDFKHGFVIRGWRGDSVVTTSGDILEKFKELRGSLRCTMQCYDWQAKDFSTIAARMGESFVKAEKSHDIGEDILNTLFKNDMLHIFDIDDLQPLGGELSSLLKTTPKQKAKDDFCDALRYAATRVPWDFTAIKGFVEDTDKEPEEDRPMTDKEYLAWEIDQRRGTVKKTKEEEAWGELEEDFAQWNEEYGS